MNIGRLARPLAHGMAMLVLSGSGWVASAQSHDAHDGTAGSTQQKHNPLEGALVNAVREATGEFHDVADAVAKGYALQFGCVSGGEFGAMGLHFVKFGLVFDGEVDVAHPEIILYEPTPDGGARLTGADYLVIAADWDAKHEDPPQLMGQLFHLFESPNRFGLPAFYTLHVWAWKGNPNGTFGNWNPDVSCDAFNPPAPQSDSNQPVGAPDAWRHETSGGAADVQLAVNGCLAPSDRTVWTDADGSSRKLLLQRRSPTQNNRSMMSNVIIAARR